LGGLLALLYNFPVGFLKRLFITPENAINQKMLCSLGNRSFIFDSTKFLLFAINENHQY
jgi:hypothetical protein